MPDDKKHFDGQGECKIHTERGGKGAACSNARGPGGCNYQKNGGPASYDPKESHHLICVSCTIAYQVDSSFSEDEKKMISGVYRHTDWCVNQAPNLINLPLKATYVADAKNADIGLPCHNWDHNCTGGYTAEVTKAMKRVWNAIKGAANNKPHFVPLSVKADLQAISDEYREVLIERGQRRGGTANGLSPEGQQKEAWWLPFSMARTPIAGARPVSVFGQRPRWKDKLKRDAAKLF